PYGSVILCPRAIQRLMTLRNSRARCASRGRHRIEDPPCGTPSPRSRSNRDTTAARSDPCRPSGSVGSIRQTVQKCVEFVLGELDAPRGERLCDVFANDLTCGCHEERGLHPSQSPNVLDAKTICSDSVLHFAHWMVHVVPERSNFRHRQASQPST